MFQYSLYLFLNKEKNITDLSFSDFIITKHHNGIDIAKAFKLKLNLKDRLSFYLIENLKPFFFNKLIRPILRRIIPSIQNISMKNYFEVNEFVYDSDVLRQMNSIFIGTWQSLKYFENIRSIVLDEFKFKDIVDKSNREVIRMIKESKSVSIHIRRGDFLTSNWSNTHFVIRDLSYYNRAIDFIKAKIINPYFFIFSDDMDWVKNNLIVENAFYIEHNEGKKSYIDMHLMSLCEHNIIANSTFSWWGAWLNQNNSKIVVAPNIWLRGVNCKELMPKDWIYLEL